MLPLRTRLRAYLGTDLLPLLESHMTTMRELLTGLGNQATELSAAQQASILNLHNALDKLAGNVRDLEQAVANGEVSDEVKALALDISTNLADMKRAADTADDGFEPIDEPSEGETPVVTDPSAEVPASPEVPADETPTVPVEGQPVVDEAPTSRKR